MSHVDEGRLHAWLDYGRSGMSEAEYLEIGSHFARCPECSALLADEREVRDRAAALLGATGPRALSAPSFEELAARARPSIQSPTPEAELPAPVAQQKKAPDWSGRRRRQIAGLAWAASVMAALGLGWAASTLMDREQVAIQTLETAADEPAGAAPMSGPEGGSVAAEPSAAKAAPAPSPAAMEARTLADASIAAPAPPPPVATGSQTPQAPDPARGDQDDLAVVDYGQQAREVASGRIAAEQAPARAAQAGADEPRVLTAPNGAPPTAEPIALSAQAPPAAPRVEEPAVGGAIVGAAPETTRISASSLPFQVEASSIPGLAATGFQSGLIWGVATAEEATQRLGRVPLIHPGFPLLRIEVPSGVETSMVRVIQALQGGGTLTVTQFRQTEGAIFTTPPGGATILRGELVVTGVGPVTVDSITTLLEGLR